MRVLRKIVRLQGRAGMEYPLHDSNWHNQLVADYIHYFLQRIP